jgi:hypothetical protein
MIACDLCDASTFCGCYDLFVTSLQDDYNCLIRRVLEHVECYSFELHSEWLHGWNGCRGVQRESDCDRDERAVCHHHSTDCNVDAESDSDSYGSDWAGLLRGQVNYRTRCQMGKTSPYVGASV